MIKFIFRSGLVIASAVGLASCIGGRGGQPLQGAAVANIMGNLNTVLQKLPRNTGAVTLPVTGATTSAVGGVNASAIDCETVSPTPVEDVDADGIAKLKVSTFNCTSLTSGVYTYTRKGTMTVKDADDNVAGTFAGMSVEFNLEDMSYVNVTTGDKTGETMKGFWKFMKSGPSLVSEASFEGHYKLESTSYNFKTDYGFNYTWNWTHTPDNTALPWVTGSEEFDGSYELNGLFHMEDQNGVHKQGNGKFVIQYYSQNIKYDTACAKWFKSGSIFIEDGNGSKFEVRYACATAKFYINGKESTIYTP